MTRLFVPREQWRGNTLSITGNDVHYITRVLRLGPGDALTVLDCEGRAFNAVIKTAGNREVRLDVVGEIKSDSESSVKVALFQAIPKGDKMDLVIQKAAELGVARIVPVVTDRVVVHLDAARGAKRLERWRKISAEAARQCGRTVAPEVEPVVAFEDALNLLAPYQKREEVKKGTGNFLLKSSLSPFSDESPFEASPLFHLGIMPWEGEESVSLRECLSGKRPDAVSIFVGPEGGFSLSEVYAARERGITTVTLGRRILRTETAGIITPALVMYALGEIG